MADDLSPGEIRAHKFGLSRRGYDRAEVTRFLERIADQVESLAGNLAAIEDRLDQFGIGDIPHFKDEIDQLGNEVAAVLAAAMDAADGMRTRARADAEEMLERAEEASTTARGDAWESGTELLRQAQAAADGMLEEAGNDALFVRAEAEQDAKRLVADARRQADEIVRSSREQGERIVVHARAESETLLETARQSAEKAQERARALENRRSELLGELAAAETSIRDIETAKTESSHSRSPEAGKTTQWPEDDGSIRILPAARRAAQPATVDADAMAAEVEEMRASFTLPQPPAEPMAGPPEPDSSPKPRLATASEPESTATLKPESEPEPDFTETPKLEPEPVPAPVREPELSPVDDFEAKPALEPVEKPEPEPVAERESEPTPEPTAALDGAPEPTPEARDKVTVVDEDPAIAALFARLRQPAAPEPVPAVDSAKEQGAEPDDEDKTEPAAPLRAVPDLEVGDGFDRRDRLLLPIENTALRGLKRRIVELQNYVLEELRTSGGDYRLGRELVVELMGDELDVLLTDSYRVGHTAAAESVGAAEPQLTGGPHRGAAEVLADGLHTQVQDVLRRSDELGARRLSSDVSRVFRSWRTDEAERSVRTAARRAFNDGLLAGYARLGVAEVELVAPGRPCGRCAADTGVSWPPGGDLPAGVEMPPVSPVCAAMLVPKGSNGFDTES